MYEGLNANLETAIPPEAHDPGFVDYCIDHYRALSPVNQWLSAVMKDAPAG